MIDVLTGLGLRKAVSDEVEASGAVTSKLRKLSDSMAISSSAFEK